MVFGILFALVGCYVGFEMISWGFAAIPVGILWFLYGLKFPKDIWAFSINVMGGKNQIPVAEGHTELVREFITKLQNAKIAYDEGNA